MTMTKAAEAEFINQAKLDEISRQAAQSPRRRKNYNFHRTDEEICHRLLNAMEPDSYIRPHRHLEDTKDETLIVVRGRMGLVVFDGQGNIVEKALLCPGGDVVLVNIPHGIFHTWVSLETRCVFFEAKAGPFRPLTQAEMAPWAPAEGEGAVAGYLASLQRLFETGPEPQ